MIVFHRHRTRSIGAAVLFAFALGACQKVPMLPGLSAHRIDIQQGNVVTQEMVAKLKPGMTRQQVRFVLGTPPIVDPFHPQRWDYVYYYRKAGTVTEHRRLEGDVIPAAEGGGSVVDGEPGGSPGSAGVKPTK
jgi:outer membrane protein assembly factor BamE